MVSVQGGVIFNNIFNLKIFKQHSKMFSLLNKAVKAFSEFRH